MDTKKHNYHTTKQPVLLFDGVCNLCNGSVQWLIRRDPKGIFKFASLQSSFGQKVLQQHGFDTQKLNSVLLLDGKQLYQKSDVPLQVARRLGGVWSCFYVFKIIPSFIRHGIYDWIARNRYRWFGKQESCWLPTTELQERFL